MKRCILVGFLFLLVFALYSCADNKQENAGKDLKTIIAQYERDLIPLQKEYNLQNYLAASTGEFATYDRAAQLRFEIGNFFSDKKTYKKLKRIVENEQIADPLLARQAQLLYYQYLQHQIPKNRWRSIVDHEKNLQRQFSQYRVAYKGTELNNTQIRDLMKQSKSSEELEAIWKATKYIGRPISTKLVELVKVRNAAARDLGFDNYFEMQLFVSDLQPEQMDRIFDELDILTRGPYTQLKADIDNYLCKNYNISAEMLRPWHYQDMFFQNPPQMSTISYDSLYSQADIVQMGVDFYSSLGFDVEHIARKSNLYPKENKSQLGLVRNIDFEGDVRISMNLKQDEYSMNQFLYEMGFALYFKNISTTLPYALRKPAHFFATDAVSIFFSTLSTDPQWLGRIHTFSEDEKQQLHKTFMQQQRLRKFVFSRWAQVVYRFEKELYLNPDQDLNNLWWQLVENYQLLERPEKRDEPDWACKEHFVAMPCTYHNYLLGELFAAQLHHHLSSSILSENKSDKALEMYGKKELGNFLRNEIFEHGASYPWQELVRRSTGEELNPDYFYRLYVR